MEIQKTLRELSEKLSGNTAKYCKDCKWSRQRLIFKLFGEKRMARCGNPNFKRFDADKEFVDPNIGEFESLPFCSIAREIGPCRPSGEYWEEK